MKFNIGNFKVWLNCVIREVNEDNTVLGLSSGNKFTGKHFLFLDYDRMDIEDVIRDFQKIIYDNRLKRGIIVKSSEKGYHALSFTPLHYNKMLGMVSKSGEDSKHKAWTIKNGFSTLRITKKQKYRNEGFEFVHAVVNMEGTNFYHFNAEKAYFVLLESEEDDLYGDKNVG